MRKNELTRRSFAAGLAAAPVLLAQAPQPAGPFEQPLEFTRKGVTPKVHPFALSEVRLLPGPFQQTAKWNRDYLLRLPADRLLHTFRLTAGLPTTATPLGGWEKPDGELRGHFLGHYLSGCALSGDAELTARGNEIVAELAKCQAKLEGGYLGAYPTSWYDKLDQGQKIWAPFYTYHKIMAGLFDMYVLAGNKQALDVVTGMATWVDNWTASKPEAHMQEILKIEFGGMAEVLYNLAGVTDDVRWARAGDRFSKKTFLNPLASRRDELRGLHANTHIPQVIGAARRYELSGDPRFHDVASFFYETVTESRTYATGGSSVSESWRVPPGQLAKEVKGSSHTQECCCAYNMMKLTRHLYSWSGDARYFDYYERNLFNHRLGTIQPETGHATYFLSLTPGAWKTIGTEDHTFWCCTGTAAEEFAKLNDSIYYYDDSGVYVNLFLASELDWRERGIRLRQETKFPDEQRTLLTVSETRGDPWTLRLRIPVWAEGAAVKLNGHAVEGMASPGSYLKLTRSWKKGDRIEMELPMRLTAEPLPDDPKIQAFVYGPIVLAGALGKQGLTEDLVMDKQWPEVSKAPMEVPDLTASGSSVTDWIKPAGGPLTFKTSGQKQDITLVPISRLWERFAVYWRVV